MNNMQDIIATLDMIDNQHLDVRTITMGISLLDCCDESVERVAEKVYKKITTKAEKLVETGEAIEREFGIPIVNKRISVTPIAMLAGASGFGGLAIILQNRAFYGKDLLSLPAQIAWQAVHGGISFLLALGMMLLT